MQEVKQQQEDMVDWERRKTAEHREMVDSSGLELVPLMARQNTGRPRRNPSTGYMTDHSLNSTDVTKHAASRGATGRPWSKEDNRTEYSSQLGGQVREGRSE